MYFPDLSPYTYLQNPQLPEGASEVLNVGWLEPTFEFRKGVVDPQLVEKLLQRCLHPVNQTRGVYVSPFLHAKSIGQENWYRVRVGGVERALGSAELWIPGENGRWYASPNLVYHYVRDLGYMPPEEYLR